MKEVLKEKKEINLKIAKQKIKKDVSLYLNPLKGSSANEDSTMDNIKVNNQDMLLLYTLSVGDNICIVSDEKEKYFKYSTLLEKEWEYLMILDELPEKPYNVHYILNTEEE